MENSVNNNVNGNVTNNATNVNPVAASTAVNSVQPAANVTVNNVQSNQNVENNEQTKKMNIYVVISIFVGFILLIAIILLVCLLTGSISNRNRLTCTITTKESEYNLTIQKIYKFDGDFYTRVDNTHTFSYDVTLTDDMYNQEFEKFINDTSGVSEYGFETKIKKEGNIVTITSYNPKFFDETYEDIKEKREKEGYTCK